MIHWFLHFTGSDNVSGPWYGFWSGFGSDLGEYVIAVTLATGLVGWWRRHNCHIHRCWRLQWHPHPDHGHPVCRRHHPHEIV